MQHVAYPLRTCHTAHSTQRTAILASVPELVPYRRFQPTTTGTRVCARKHPIAQSAKAAGPEVSMTMAHAETRSCRQGSRHRYVQMIHLRASHGSNSNISFSLSNSLPQSVGLRPRERKKSVVAASMLALEPCSAGWCSESTLMSMRASFQRHCFVGGQPCHTIFQKAGNCAMAFTRRRHVGLCCSAESSTS